MSDNVRWILGVEIAAPVFVGACIGFLASPGWIGPLAGAAFLLACWRFAGWMVDDDD